MIYKHYRDVSISEQEWNARWPNFPIQELRCKCCGEYYHDPDALDKLQMARTTIGKPFNINSGHRCKKHNEAVHGSKNSEHLKIAFDISIRGHDREQLLDALLEAGFTTFGFYSTFIHTDPRPWRTWYMGDEHIWKPIYEDVVNKL